MLWAAFVAILSACTPSNPVAPTSSTAVIVEGHVAGEHGPLPDATVRIQATNRQTTTDKDGNFRVPVGTTDGTRLTAWKVGHYIGSVAANEPQPLLIALRPLPAEDWAGYQWVDPRPDQTEEHNCANCHAEIYRQWSGGGHGDAAGNRRFLNLYDGTDWHGRPGAGWSLLDDHPHGAGVCTACHAPTVELDDPAYHDLRLATGVSALGVHCDYCHKIQDAPAADVGLAHGRFGLKLLRPRHGQLFFGPWDDVDRGEDTYSALYGESRYCASCHEGTVFGVHAYGTYSEWLDSAARRRGQQCQSCHMAPDGAMTNIAPGHGGVERDPGAISNHRFAGGTREMLQRALSVEMKSRRLADRVVVDVEVLAQQAGHRVPTGFPDRNLVLLVEAFDAEDGPLDPLSGPSLPDHAGAEVAGRAGKLFAKQLTDENGNSPAPFWRSITDVVDTRLFPEQADHSRYEFPLATASLRVRLLYRRHWPHVATEKGWPDNETIVKKGVRNRFLTDKTDLLSCGDGKTEADGRRRVGVSCVKPRQRADADL